MKSLSIILFFSLFLYTTAVFADAEHQQKQEQKQEQEHQVQHTEITPEIAKQAGIVLATASSGSIERHMQVYGRLVTPPTLQSQVRARFPGLIMQLHANTGDQVQKGQVLAIIESNDSLRPYAVKAPISGQVQERWLNVGDISTGDPIFTLLNQTMLWAELSIFPSQRDQVITGQTVHIQHTQHPHNSKIISITPAMSAGNALPFVVARVPLENTYKDMAPGDKVLADIDIELVQANVRVSRKAIQEIDGQKVVFIYNNGQYQAQPVILGVQDENFAEVIEGIRPGQNYVAENSYLIKAELGKTTAEHSH